MHKLSMAHTCNPNATAIVARKVCLHMKYHQLQIVGVLYGMYMYSLKVHVLRTDIYAK